MNRSRVVIIGAGFAGYDAARSLTRALPPDSGVEIVLVNPVDYFLYLPLLPEVAAGILDPRRITVPIPDTLRGVRLVLGDVASVSLTERTVSYTDPEDRSHSLGYDRLILAVGSVNKLLPIPGVAEHAHGFRGVAEALYLRDHVVRQFELADSTDDADERTARCTFVVVGAGYTGTEVAAHGPLFTDAIRAGHPHLRHQKVRWLLLDLAPKVLPELDPRLSRAADRVLRERGVEILTETSVREATRDGVRLTTGEFVPTRTIAWCVGVTRQGKLAGRNVAASLGYGRIRRHKHHDLGFVVDLGGTQAAANPLRIPLSGLPAKTVARGYHLLSMPGNRVRTAIDWILDAVTGRQVVQLGLVRSAAVPLDTEAPRTAQEGTRSG
ncbi:NAD(P)/FAD-dependent oxidoreductase [Pseudonocardia yunnanensis]|uniref:NAD(P)/FAD-dependent oxidoreductase n=1 Tax=Pseudonocardia yunnanensis TaxID=58107 RepID=A0ABW4FA94_9PSEU